MKTPYSQVTDRIIFELYPIIDTPDDVDAADVDDGSGPWCPEDYNPEYIED